MQQLRRKFSVEAADYKQRKLDYNQIVEKERQHKFFNTFSQNVVVKYIVDTIEHVNRAYDARNRDGIYNIITVCFIITIIYNIENFLHNKRFIDKTFVVYHLQALAENEEKQTLNRYPSVSQDFLQFQKILLEKEYGSEVVNDDGFNPTRKETEKFRANLSLKKNNALAKHKKELEKRDQQLDESVVGE